MSMLYRSTWLWPVLILLFTGAVGLIILAPTSDTVNTVVPIRPLLLMLFLFVCPGMTVVRFFRVGEAVSELVIGVALSFTVGAFVAGIFLYAHAWSPIYILDVLLGFCLAGAISQLLIAFSRWLISTRSDRRK
jgi:hypothetical protein